ncbi:MAG: hypothetical protein ACFFED_12555 [Candidatus Thorarchaeota archaeon]
MTNVATRYPGSSEVLDAPETTETSTMTTSELDLTPIFLTISSIELVAIVLLVALYFKQRKSG